MEDKLRDPDYVKFDEKFDPHKMQDGWSFSKWELFNSMMKSRFPNLAQKQNAIEKTGGEGGAWWYWKSVVRASPKMGMWWWYALGSFWVANPVDFDRIILKEAKHMVTIVGKIVHFVPPSVILKGILGLGPRVEIVQNIVSSNLGESIIGSFNPVENAVIESLPNDWGNLPDGPFVPVEKDDRGRDIIRMTQSPDEIPRGDGKTLRAFVRAGEAIGKWFARLFGLSWGRNPPDLAKGMLGAQVIGPLLMLEVPFGNSKEERRDTGVPPRYTSTILDQEFKGGAGLIVEQRKAGQMTEEEGQSEEVQNLLKDKKAEDTVFVLRTINPGVRMATYSLASEPTQSMIPSMQLAKIDWTKYALPIGIGVGALALAGTALVLTRR